MFNNGFDFPYRANSNLEFYLLENMHCSSSARLLAWRIVNVSLRTDVRLFPPFLIALSRLHMASAILGKDLRSWFADLAVDMDKIQEITKHILALYDLWKGYDERKEINSILQKCQSQFYKKLTNESNLK